MAMDVKGITWVGNIYQKFENMCLEVEDAMFEETVKYIENQMQTVGESVKKIYSDVMQDLLLPPSCGLDETSASEFPIPSHTNDRFTKKSFQDSEKITEKANPNQTTEDSRINHDVDDVIHAESCDADVALVESACCNSVKGNTFISHARQYVGSGDTNSNLGSDGNQKNENMVASKSVSEIILSKTDACSTPQSCELSNGNQNHAAAVSKPGSDEVTTIDSLADCCNEIQNASIEEIPSVLGLVKSAEEKEMRTNSYSSRVLFGDSHAASMVRTMQPDDCSYSTIIVSHPETWSLDVSKIDTLIGQGHKIIQQDDELNLEETCVMVTRDDLQSVPNAGVNLMTSKNKKRQPFSLSQKVARRQEYEELAVWHENNAKGKGDCVENLWPYLQEDRKRLLLHDISEPEWELL